MVECFVFLRPLGLRLGGSVCSPTCMPGLSLSHSDSRTPLALLHNDGICPPLLQCFARHLQVIRCETQVSKRPFTRPHGPFRCRLALAGSTLLPYFFDSVTPIPRARCASTSILGLSREHPGTSTAKTRFPRSLRHSWPLNSPVAPLQGFCPSGSKRPAKPAT